MSHWRWFEVTNAYLIENQYWWKWCGRKETHEYVVCAKCKIRDLTISRFKMKSAITSWMTMECACHVIFTTWTTNAHLEWYGFCKRHLIIGVNAVFINTRWIFIFFNFEIRDDSNNAFLRYIESRNFSYLWVKVLCRQLMAFVVWNFNTTIWQLHYYCHIWSAA